MRAPAGGAVVLGVRPEHVRLAAAPFEGSVPARTEAHASGIGGWSVLTLRLDPDTALGANAPSESRFRPGDAVHVSGGCCSVTECG